VFGLVAVLLLLLFAYAGPRRGAPALVVLAALLAAGAAVWYAVLSFTNMERFVIVTLFVRSSLDIFKQTGAGARDSAAAPASLIALAFLAGAIVFLLSTTRLPANRPGVWLGRWIVLFVAAAAISAIGAGDWSITLTDLLRVLASVAMFFVVGRLLTQTGRPLTIVHAILAGGAIPVILGVVGSQIGLRVTETKLGVTRVVSTFLIANPYAYFLVFLGLTALALTVTLRSSPRRWVYGVAAAVFAGALVTTNVRTAWIAYACGALVIGLTVGWRLVVAIVAVVVLVVAMVPSVRAQFEDLNTPPNADTISENSLTWRFRHWENIYPLTHGHELTGIGLAMTVSRAPDVAKEPHNDYLRAYLEMGVFGLVAFVGMLVMFVVVGWRAFRRAITVEHRAIGLAFLAVAIATVVASLTDNLVSNVGVVWYVYALAAAASWCLWTSHSAQLADASAEPQGAPRVQSV
jgi:O-antigen ligase